MAHIILCYKQKYNVYSTVMLAPIFDSALTLEQLTRYIKEQYGKQGITLLANRLEYAHKKGTSALEAKSLEDSISCNCAGDKDEELSNEEFIKKYLS